MIPTRGSCHGVFLLVHSAKSARRRNVNDWISFAESMPTFMAAALDLRSLGKALISSGLASSEEGFIVLDPRLMGVGDVASEEVLKRIAAVILRALPPPWLSSAIVDGTFAPEFVPATAMGALSWIGDDLEHLMTGVHEDAAKSDPFLSWLGFVGESLVVEIERMQGAAVRHVSQISDHFGYDIEARLDGLRRLEVKTSVLGKEFRIFLSRNEAEKASAFSKEWFLIHVVLEPHALTAEVVSSQHVRKIRQLAAPILVAALPSDTKHCKWIDSVELKTEGLAWQSYLDDRLPPPHSVVAGFLSSEYAPSRLNG